MLFRSMITVVYYFSMFSKEQQKILCQFADQSDKLFSLGIIRTDSFTGEIGEFVASQHFGLGKTDRVTRAVDALDNLGHRYQIKAKVRRDCRLTFSSNAIDFRAIDYLVIVFFDKLYTPTGVLRIRSDQFPDHECRVSEDFLDTIDYDLVKRGHIKIPENAAKEIRRFGEIYDSLIANSIIRSRRVVGDIGEFYACQYLSLTSAKALNQKGVDAFDSDGTTYEVKTRRVYESGRRTGRTRRLNNLVGKNAEKLVVVALDKAFRCAGMWLIPMKNVVNPKSATLRIVRSTPSTKIIVETSIDWLR